MKWIKLLTRGLIKENPVFRLVLGLCPTLAVTTSLENGLGMGLAATFVLVCANIVIAAIRNLIPAKVRIPCFIVVIATFVTIVDLLMNAFAPELHRALGIFIPLIVVNCIILGRAEAFASRNPVLDSAVDGLGMGMGFTMALAALGAGREILGAGTITLWGDMELVIPGYSNSPMVMMILAPGGFVLLGVLLALMNHLEAHAARKQGRALPPPLNMDCRHCTLCRFGQ